MIGPLTVYYFARQDGWSDDIQPSTSSAGAPAREGDYPLHGASGDIANGRLFARMFRGRLMHVHETGQWLEFITPRGWAPAPPGAAMRAAKEVVAALRQEAARRYATAPDDPATKRLMAHVERSSNEQRLRAMIELAKSE